MWAWKVRSGASSIFRCPGGCPIVPDRRAMAVFATPTERRQQRTVPGDISATSRRFAWHRVPERFRVGRPPYLEPRRRRRWIRRSGGTAGIRTRLVGVAVAAKMLELVVEADPMHSLERLVLFTVTDHGPMTSDAFRVARWHDASLALDANTARSRARVEGRVPAQDSSGHRTSRREADRGLGRETPPVIAP